MERIGSTVKKRPFLRKGTGLKRFYKEIDINSHFSVINRKAETARSPSDGKVDADDDCEDSQQFHFQLPTSVLKTADSPKRNLSVHFSPSSRSIGAAKINSKSARALNFWSSDYDKENCNPNTHISDEDDSISESTGDGDDDAFNSGNDGENGAEDEWETDPEDIEDTDSVVELNESIVDEVFKSILKAKAERELIHTGNGNTVDPILGRGVQGSSSQPITSKMNCLTSENTSGVKRIPSLERELEMFEKMERMTTHQSFCSTASTVQRFVNTELNLSPVTDSPPVQPFVTTSGRIQQPPLSRTSSIENLMREVDENDRQLRTILQPWLQQVPAPKPNIQPPSLTNNPAIASRKSELEQDDQYLRTLLLNRIHQLESEIIQHRVNNQRLRDTREKLETESKSVESSKKDFEILQTKELAVIDELKRRLKRDQEQLTKERKKIRQVETSEQEVETERKTLKDKVTELENDLKVRTGRWASTARNFKKTIDELKAENSKLMKNMEELRNDKFKLNQRLRRAMKMSPSVSPKSLDTVPVPLMPPDSLLALPQEVTDTIGVKRIFDRDGQCLEVHYANGDIKDLREVGTTGMSKYYYKEADSWEITHLDGTQTLHFGTGEIQIKYPNGIHEIKYVTGTVRRTFPDGTEECLFPDKTLVRTGLVEGEKEIHLPNGQIEHHSSNLKLRIYPDGTEKVLYNDGSSLTRYASGRQRFRNVQGQIVYDRPGGETISEDTTGMVVPSIATNRPRI